MWEGLGTRLGFSFFRELRTSPMQRSKISGLGRGAGVQEVLLAIGKQLDVCDMNSATLKIQLKVPLGHGQGLPRSADHKWLPDWSTSLFLYWEPSLKLNNHKYSNTNSFEI